MKENIVGRILQEGTGALKEVYLENREPFIAWLVKNYSCEHDEAMEVYQSTIIILYENVVNKKLTQLTSSTKTYLFSIGKNKILELKRKQNRFTSDSEFLPEVDDRSSEEKMLKEKRIEAVEAAIDDLGEPCKSLLLQFYYHNKSIIDLMKRFDYKNESSAKNQKYKCLQRLRKMIKEQVSIA